MMEPESDAMRLVIDKVVLFLLNWWSKFRTLCVGYIYPFDATQTSTYFLLLHNGKSHIF